MNIGGIRIHKLCQIYAIKVLGLGSYIIFNFRRKTLIFDNLKKSPACTCIYEEHFRINIIIFYVLCMA